MSTMSTNSSSSLRSLPHAPVQHTNSFSKTCKSMKHAPLFSVAEKYLDMSSDEEENLHMKQMKKVHCGADHLTNKMLSIQDKSPACQPHMNFQRNPSILGPKLSYQSLQCTTCLQPASANPTGANTSYGCSPSPTYSFSPYSLYPVYSLVYAPFHLTHLMLQRHLDVSNKRNVGVPPIALACAGSAGWAQCPHCLLC